MKKNAPATERNRAPIFEVLKEVIPASADVLELGSGSGEHANFFTAHMNRWRWQPSDCDPTALESIEAYRQDSGSENFLPPITLDVRKEWPNQSFNAVVAINVVHISPWQATRSICRGASKVLKPGGILYLYGPYFISGEDPAPSNVEFDKWLRAQNEDFGVRKLAEVSKEAEASGLQLERVVAMPANNLSVVFRYVA